MLEEISNTNREDPFLDYSLSLLLPQTSRVYMKKETQNKEFASLEAFHGFLVELNSSEEITEQANTVLQNASKHLANGLQIHLPTKDENREASLDGIGPLHRKRPSLGFKRARFTLKPTKRQLTSNVDPCIEIDQLPDPEEFFRELEKNENAVKELQKLEGLSDVDCIDHKQSKSIGQRRPGILGKKVSYKHYYSLLPEQEVSVLSSQENGQDILLTSKSRSNMANLQPETTNQEVTLHEATGSITETEDRVTELLEVLLSTCKELDEGDMVTMLQERLQINQLELDELHLPDLGAVKRYEATKSPEMVLRPMMELMDLQQIVKSSVCGRKKIRNEGTSKSPFASMSSLCRQLSKIDETKHPFPLPADSESLPVVGSPMDPVLAQPSPASGVFIDQKQSHPSSDHICQHETNNSIYNSGPTGYYSKNSEEFSLNIKLFEHDTSKISDLDPGKCLVEDFVVTSDVLSGNYLSINDNDTRTMLSSVDAELVDQDDDCLMRRCVPAEAEGLTDNVVHEDVSHAEDSSIYVMQNSPSIDDDKLKARKNRSDDNSASSSYGTHSDMGDGFQSSVYEGDAIMAHNPPCENLQQDSSDKLTHPNLNRLDDDLGVASCSVPNVAVGLDYQVEDVQYENVSQEKVCNSIEAANGGSVHHNNVQTGQLEIMNKLSPVGRSGKANISLEQNVEHQDDCTTYRDLSNNESMVPQKRDKRRALSHRQSLAGAGTLWKSGVRRSTRIRSRPLEFWRGERLLYGRIHNSLATVIGVKYSSPGTSTMKVKSFVPEKYSDLVERASLH